MDQAQIEIPCKDLPAEISFFEELGYQLINIYPDDNPQLAVMNGFGQGLRIDVESITSPPHMVLLTDDDELVGSKKKSPGGTTIKYLKKTYEVQYPRTDHSFEVRKLRGGDPWVIGRAGMLYRDLVPSRLGGGIMASHIHIPEGGGPVPDMVHYHTIGFQLIYCYKGWVKLVYEDQGEPFVLSAGDCVTQPPEIRHRVLEASDNLEVIEIGVPAEHMTTIDHELELPTQSFQPNREFGGQVFCHHKESEAQWENWNAVGFEFRETGIMEATRGKASVKVIKSKRNDAFANLLYSDDIHFSFILGGSTELEVNQIKQILSEGDAFVVPPDQPFSLKNCTVDLEILEVRIPHN